MPPKATKSKEAPAEQPILDRFSSHLKIGITYYVFLPPELSLVHPLPESLVRGAQRLPSIMRRVESILLAIQLKDVIDYSVPASKILEALTAASCQETFCYERAELLGDAYLKWVVSKFLFLRYPQKHEGQLTRMRQQMMSNMVLYEYALNKGLQSYNQADRFAPSRWSAPGVLPVFDEDKRMKLPCLMWSIHLLKLEVGQM
ncbi:hypothetical protein ACJRO7_027909 [Eucalyptus globulus]|uniref:RNase III domain-containing protein n=1 Tax=Eucalyptus globulus TaxID=34317 RepID=A0ABD3JXX1_EUCGL